MLGDQKISWSGVSMTFFSVSMNSAASAPYTTRWSHVRFSTICFSTPMRPLASTVTVGLDAATARMAAVPVDQGTAGKLSM